jgi:MFS transporter, DHA2 family, methylenomycin A resistance protein
LQAVFAATLTPNAQAILRRVSAPESTGRNFGLMGSVLGGGAAAGPMVGGIVIAAGGWQAVFLVNIPVIGLALWAVARTVPGDITRPAGSSGPQGVQGRIFSRAFGAAFLCQATTTLALYSLLLLVPMLLDQRGWSSFETGLAMTAFTVGNLVMGPLGGRLGDELGRRKPARLGISTAALAAGTLAVWGPGVNAVVLISSITAFGLGIGFAVPSIMTAAIESVPEERTATAGGIFQTARYSGSIPASLAFMFVVGDSASGAGAILVIAAVAAVLAIGASSWLPSLADTDRPQLSIDDA